MKFLYNPFRDSQTRGNTGRLFVEGDIDDSLAQPADPKDDKKKILEQLEKDKGIDAILKNPLAFSLQHIQQLETEADGFNANQKRKFRDLVDYHLTLSSRDIDSSSVGILLKIYKRSGLKKNLSSKVIETIEKIADNQMAQFKGIVEKKSSAWTDKETVKVSRLYRLFSSEESSKFEELLAMAKKKLTEKRNLFLEGLTVTEVEGKVQQVIEKGGMQKPLTYEEQIVLLEIEKVFPKKESDWQGKEKEYEQWASRKTKIMDGVFKDIEEALQKPKNYLLWDVLQDMDVSSEREESIQSITQRRNAAQFLVFAQEQEVLARTHWNLLKEIEKDAEGRFAPQTIDSEEDVIGSSKELKDIITKKESLEEKKKVVETKIIESVITDDKEDEGVPASRATELGKEYRKVQEKESLAIEKAKEVTAKENVEEAKEVLQKKREEKITQKEATNDVEKKAKIEKEIDLIKEGEDGLSKLIPEDNKEKEIKDIQKNIEAVKQSLKKLERVTDDPNMKAVEKEIKLLQNWEDVDRELEATQTQEKQIRESLVDVVDVDGETKKSIEKISEKIEDLRHKQVEIQREGKSFEKYREIYQDPKKQSAQIADDFVKKLEKRVEDHKVSAADMDVLWEIQEDAEGKQKLAKELPKQYGELREALEEVLFDPNGYLDQIVGDLKGDSLSEWTEVLHEKLSNENLKEQLKKQGFDVEEVFGGEGLESVDVGELLVGAKSYFGDRIQGRLEKAITQNNKEEEREKAKEILDSYRESTTEQAGMIDAEAISGNQEWYLAMKQKTEKSIATERIAHHAILDDKQNTLLHKDKKGKKEKELLQEAFEERAQELKKGKVIEDGEAKIFVPGKDDIAEMSLKTQRNQEVIKKTTNVLKDKLREFQQKVEQWHRTDSVSQKNLPFSEESMKDELKGILAYWPEAKALLKQNIAEQKSLCLAHADKHPNKKDFRDLFVKDFFEKIENAFKSTDDLFSELKKEAKSTNYELTGEREYFFEIGEQLGLLENHSNFRDGIMAEESDRIEKELDSNTKVVSFLQREKLFKDRDEFKTRFRNLRGEYNEKFHQYRNNINSVSTAIESDMGMKDGEFIQKYKIDKEAARKIVQAHRFQQDDFSNAWNEFTGGKADSGFEDDWYNEYEKAVSKDDPTRMNAVLEKLKGIEDITSRVEQAEEDSVKLTKFLRAYDEDQKHKTSKFWNFSLNKTEFSLYDIYRIVKESFDAQKKHWKRKSDRNVATIGVTFWGENNRWGREFSRMAEESEETRYKEFETQFGDRPGWEILEAIESSRNTDMVRGCINLLSRKGFLKWDDPILWRALNRLSGKTYFTTPADFDLSPHQILEKVKMACEMIWTPEVFRQWETGLEGDLKKAKEQYDGEFAKYENDDKPRTAILAGMLQRWSQGDVEDVDPARYEHFLFAAFRDGKMNGQPDQRWYFLIMGVSTRNPRTGQPLISKDVLMRVNKEFLQRFPFVDFLADKESPKLNGRIVPKGTPGAHEIWTEDDYRCWADMLGTGNGSFDPKSEPAMSRTETFFYQVINESAAATQRVQRMGRFAQAPDHDDGVNYLIWDQNRVMENLNIESTGRGQFSEDFWRSWLAGFDKYVKNKKSIIDHGDIEWGGQAQWDGPEGDRNRHLREIGKSIKVALTVTQSLQGNKATQRGSTTFSQDEWDKESGYSIYAEKNRNKINKMMRLLMKERGTDEYEEILDLKLRDEFGKEEKIREKTDRWKDKNKKVVELLDSSHGDTVYFKNTGLVERALNAYCAGQPLPDYLT